MSNQTVGQDVPTNFSPPKATLRPNGCALPRSANHRATAATRGDANAERRKHSIDADKADRSNRGCSAEVVLIPKPLRCEWMDVMAHDARISMCAYRVAGLIGSHFNRYSGETFLRQDTVADALKVSVRQVRRAIGELEACGYLIVRRRELGVRKTDKRRACGGKGVANVYLPAFERSQVAATNAGRRLADRVDEAWQRIHDRAAERRAKEDTGVLHSEGKGGHGSPPLEPGGAGQRRTNPVAKEDVGVLPTLGNPTDYYPSRERVGARVNAPAHPLGAAADTLRKKLGRGFETWFGKVTVIGLDRGVLTLGAPSAFVRDYLRGKHEFDVLTAWNEAHGRRQFAQRVDFEEVRK
jgi:hypothetical protein